MQAIHIHAQPGCPKVASHSWLPLCSHKSPMTRFPSHGVVKILRSRRHWTSSRWSNSSAGGSGCPRVFKVTPARSTARIQGHAGAIDCAYSRSRRSDRLRVFKVTPERSTARVGPIRSLGLFLSSESVRRRCRPGGRLPVDVSSFQPRLS